MTTNHSFDFCVLGAGLAGLATAKQLMLKDARVALIDPNQVASGASGTPLGLVNPATGRFGTMVWEAESCFKAIYEDLALVQKDAGNDRPFYKNTGILRPAQDEKMASRMQENAETQEWPDGWCQWLDREQVAEINSDLNCVQGGMWLPYGLTVDVGAYLQAKTAYLVRQGLNVFTETDYEISDTGQGYHLKLDGGPGLHTDALVFTSGYDLHRSEYWDFLPINPVKGQVAVFHSPLVASFDYSVSALGYLASMSDHRFVAGSTYEHHFEDREPDAEGLEYLKKRLSKVYPRLFEEATLQSQWAAVRASTPNRKPYVGAHPTEPDMYVFAGLGSKGMLYSEYMASLLTDFIYEKADLPEELSVSRV